MENSEHEISFDHYLTEQLGFWLRHSPEVPLPLSVFYNILSSNTVICFDENFYSENIYQGCWGKELKELIKIGKLQISRRELEMADSILLSHIPLDLKPLGRFEDTVSLIYCIRQNIPLRLSERACDHIDYAVENAMHVLQVGELPIDNSGLRSNKYLKWIVDVEVPELERRSQPLREKAFRENPIVAENDPDMTLLQAQQSWDYLQNSVFITPPELLSILKNTEQLQALREVVSRAATLNLTEPDIKALLREHWDSLLGRMEIADIVFTGLDVSLIPLALPGPITKPVQILVNYFIRKREDWLLSLNSFNKLIRKSDNGEKNENLKC